MNSGSSEFDYTNIFSPGGSLHQVEYASNATSNSGTAIGMKGRDGVVFVVEKITTEPLLVESENHRTFSIDSHIGAVVAGLTPDARNVVNAARIKAIDYKNSYASSAPLSYIVQKICTCMHEHTLRNGRRPFGVSLIVGSFIPDGPKMYSIESSGEFFGYHGCAIGKAAEAAKSEMEKVDIKNMSIVELVKEAAKVIYIVHDDEKDFELELSWCGEITDGKHELVPPDILKDAEDYARKCNIKSAKSNCDD